VRAAGLGRLTALGLKAAGHLALASRPPLAGGATWSPAGPPAPPAKSGRSAELSSSLSRAARSGRAASWGAPRPPKRLLHPATPHNYRGSRPGAAKLGRPRLAPGPGRTQSSAPAAPESGQGRGEARLGYQPKAWGTRRLLRAPALPATQPGPRGKPCSPPPTPPAGPARPRASALPPAPLPSGLSGLGLGLGRGLRPHPPGTLNHPEGRQEGSRGPAGPRGGDVRGRSRSSAS
jgi:hypothetical protein